MLGVFSLCILQVEVGGDPLLLPLLTHKNHHAVAHRERRRQPPADCFRGGLQRAPIGLRNDYISRPVERPGNSEDEVLRVPSGLGNAIKFFSHFFLFSPSQLRFPSLITRFIEISSGSTNHKQCLTKYVNTGSVFGKERLEGAPGKRSLGKTSRERLSVKEPY